MTGTEIDVNANLKEVGNTPADQCCGICHETEGCQGWTWNDYNGGTCWLKSEIKNTYAQAGLVAGRLCDGDGKFSL